MTTSKGGLSIIDYPFGFSIAALLFPPLVVSENNLSVLIAVTLLGGMLGSILTIVNPIGWIINRIYESQQSRVLPILSSFDDFMRRVIARNYSAALKSPSISYETDRLVGMSYFAIILAVTMFRISQDAELRSILNLDVLHAQIIFGMALVGFVAVIASMFYHIKGWKSVSQMGRIASVVMLFVARDLTNLSRNGEVTVRRMSDSGVLKALYEEVRKWEDRGTRIAPPMDSEFINRLKSLLSLEKFNKDTVDKFISDYCNIAYHISRTYNMTFLNACWWFKSNNFFRHDEFDGFLTQLQSSIDTRDWHNAQLQLPRIQDRMLAVLSTKAK